MTLTSIGSFRESSDMREIIACADLHGGILEEHGPYPPSFTDGYWNERIVSPLRKLLRDRFRHRRIDIARVFRRHGLDQHHPTLFISDGIVHRASWNNVHFSGVELYLFIFELNQQPPTHNQNSSSSSLWLCQANSPFTFAIFTYWSLTRVITFGDQ